MFRNTLLLFTGIFILVLIVLSSCSDPAIVENKTNAASEQKLFKNETSTEEGAGNKIPVIGKIIGYKIIKENGEERKIPIYGIGSKIDLDEKAIDCQYKRVYVDGEVDHYKEKSGKWLGVWDGYNKIGYQDARIKWGFTKYLAGNEAVRNNAVNAGFHPDNIMAKVNALNGSYSLPDGSYKSYHLNEVFELDNLTKSQVISLANELNNNPYNATLFMCSYKDNSVNDNPYYPLIPKACEEYRYVLDNTQNSFMMCDQFYDGSIWYRNDQRPYWDWFNDYYSSRVLSHWISLDIDGSQGDFQRLFWKADDLNIDELWLFVGNSSNIPNYLYSLGEAGFDTGWLRKFVKRYSYWYVCPDEYGDPCYCFDRDNGWILDVILYEGEFEVH